MRVGNAASIQLQLDVYGELIDAMSLARSAGLARSVDAWRFELSILKFSRAKLDAARPWHLGDARRKAPLHALEGHGLGRVRPCDPRCVEKYGLPGPVERWRKLRTRIHADICRNGFDRDRNSFVQYYGTTEVDASLLLIPQVGFLPANDARVLGTIAAIEHDLIVDGLVMRYRTERPSRPTARRRAVPRLLVLARRRP